MKKQITYNELIAHKRFDSYTDEAAYIKKLIDTGTLIPIKSAGTNGKTPALPLKYWHITEDKDYTEEIDEIKYRLSTTIDISYYLKNPDVYRQEREFVLMLSEYLDKHKDRLNTCISRNERSYDIWKREKFLTKGQGNTILKHCGIDEEKLNFYVSAEPLAYFSGTKKTPQNMLIIENLDTFYSIRQQLIKGKERILGVNFGTVIYGGGKRIAKAFGDFEICAEPYMRAEDNRIYYFGDLDYEGIGIYESLAIRYEDNVKIIPFCAAYEAMLAKSGELLELPDTKEGQNRNIGQKFFSYFDKAVVSNMKKILENSRYIPQEILSDIDL